MYIYLFGTEKDNGTTYHQKEQFSIEKGKKQIRTEIKATLL